jgi:hypothetical protein
MDQLRVTDVADIGARAAAALSGASGRPVRLGELAPISNERRRNFIARARAVDDDGRARSVIVKMTRLPSYDPAAADALASSGLVREWVATATIAARAPGRRHGAALLAGDVERGLLLFEDLGESGSLVGPLLEGSAAEAEQALTLYAVALARLHGDTADCLDLHRDTFEAVFGAGRPRRPPGWRVETDVATVVSKLGGAPPADELAQLSARLADPGPWQSLVHGDPCPDNALIVDGSVRLIDYEFARPLYALLDAIYWRIGFPTCWCAGRVPDDVARRLDAVYRDELAPAIPQARDDAAYRIELAHMAAVWLFTSLAWRLDAALGEDDTGKWGTWSVRGRLLWYLDFVIEMAGAADVLPGITVAAQGWRAELRRRWPDVLPLGLYPAFADRGGVTERKG